MTVKKILKFFPLILVGFFVWQVASAQWLHVYVEEQDAEKVKINVPLALAESLLPIIGEDHIPQLSDLNIQIHDKKVTLEDIKAIWAEVRAQGEGEFVTVEKENTEVRVGIESGFLVVRTTESPDTDVDVRIPVEFVDALLSGPGEELNVSAAIQVLMQSPAGELVTVRDGSTRVRVWVDDLNSQ